MTSRAEQRRDFAIRAIGCVVARIRGMGYVPVERHHMTIGSKHGQKRRGEAFSVGLNPYSHRGVPFNGLTLSQCKAMFGPSLALEPSAFRALYPDAVLLAKQEQLIEEYDRSTVL